MILYKYSPPSLRAQCVGVVDGDTVDLFTDEGKRRYALERYRLMGINTFELNDPDPNNRHKAQQAKSQLASWLSPSPISGIVDTNLWPLRIVTYKSDSFGRWLVDIFWTDDAGVEHHVNAELLELGLAVPYKR